MGDPWCCDDELNSIYRQFERIFSLCERTSVEMEASMRPPPRPERRDRISAPASLTNACQAATPAQPDRPANNAGPCHAPDSRLGSANTLRHRRRAAVSATGDHAGVTAESPLTARQHRPARPPPPAGAAKHAGCLWSPPPPPPPPGERDVCGRSADTDPEPTPSRAQYAQMLVEEVRRHGETRRQLATAQDQLRRQQQESQEQLRRHQQESQERLQRQQHESQERLRRQQQEQAKCQQDVQEARQAAAKAQEQCEQQATGTASLRQQFVRTSSLASAELDRLQARLTEREARLTDSEVRLRDSEACLQESEARLQESEERLQESEERVVQLRWQLQAVSNLRLTESSCRHKAPAGSRAAAHCSLPAIGYTDQSVHVGLGQSSHERRPARNAAARPIQSPGLSDTTSTHYVHPTHSGEMTGHTSHPPATLATHNDDPKQCGGSINETSQLDMTNVVQDSTCKAVLPQAKPYLFMNVLPVRQADKKPEPNGSAKSDQNVTTPSPGNYIRLRGTGCKQKTSGMGKFLSRVFGNTHRSKKATYSLGATPMQKTRSELGLSHTSEGCRHQQLGYATDLLPTRNVARETESRSRFRSTSLQSLLSSSSALTQSADYMRHCGEEGIYEDVTDSEWGVTDSERDGAPEDEVDPNQSPYYINMAFNEGCFVERR